MKYITPEEMTLSFFNALKTVIKDCIKRKRLKYKDIATKSGLSEDFIDILLEKEGIIHEDYIALFASVLSVTVYTLISKARKVVLIDKKNSSPKKDYKNAVEVAHEIAYVSGRKLGLKFVSNNDPVVDRRDKALMKRIKAQRKERGKVAKSFRF